LEQTCPRCHQNNVAKSSGSTAARHAGLLGILVANAATSYSCPACGKIPLGEFADEFQSSVKRKRILSVLGAVAILIAIVGLLMLREAL
jgi:transposase-like protein